MVNMTLDSATRPLSDVDLVKSAQQGDADAFATLFHAQRAKVYSLCLRMTKNPSDAEDLSQEAFLQVFRKLDTFRGESALSTWLHRVTTNAVLMSLRRKQVPHVYLDHPPSDQAPIAEQELGRLDARLSGAVDRLMLARALGRLSRGSRAVFILHEIHGYPHGEIAQRLNCSVGNSKSQLYRARMKMRELLRNCDSTGVGQTAIVASRNVKRSSRSPLMERPLQAA